MPKLSQKKNSRSKKNLKKSSTKRTNARKNKKSLRGGVQMDRCKKGALEQWAPRGGCPAGYKVVGKNYTP